jgi:hypothetical protein
MRGDLDVLFDRVLSNRNFGGDKQMLEQFGELSQILAALGISAAILAALRRYVDQRRWDKFKHSVTAWTHDMLAVGIRIEKQFTDDEWRSECERMLADVGFTPIEIQQIIELALVVAKGIASSRFLT